MNKTRALEIFTAVVNMGENASVEATHNPPAPGAPGDADTSPDYRVTILPSFTAQRTMDEMQRVENTLRGLDATVQFPTMTIALKDDIEAERQAAAEQQAATERAMELRAASDEELATVGGGSEQDGGTATDADLPAPEPSSAPFAGEDDLRDQRS